MDMHLTDEAEEPVEETPEDVAILYSWANLHGARYRDFSASRREYRAQVRHRAAEETRRAELEAQAAAELAAADAEQAARDAEHAIRAPGRFESSQDREWAARTADEAGRRATAERVEAARRAEAAAFAEATARREEREIAEAHVSAERQAARWNESEIRRRSLAGPQPPMVPSQAGDPYELSQGAMVDASLPTPNRALEYTQPQVYDRPSRGRDEMPAARERTSEQSAEREWRHPRGYKPDQPSGIRPASRQYSGEVFLDHRSAGVEQRRSQSSPATERAGMSGSQRRYTGASGTKPEQGTPQEPLAPAWLTAPSRNNGATEGRAASSSYSVAESLQQSREKVASRWFALKGVFDANDEGVPQPQGRLAEERTPMLSVFSLAGGVGKTSLVATLGRAVSSLGEKVLLADATSHGLLPYYFGATELKTGVVRTFSPPSGSSDPPIHLVSYEADERVLDRGSQDALASQMGTDAKLVQRVLVDVNTTSGWLIRRLSAKETILVPLAPDMTSVISLNGVEKFFSGEAGADGRPMLPYYVLNQFDASVPLHLDVREVLRRRLGERLLPFAIRRSTAVSEALAEGMTVMDYQADGGIAEDYLNVAKWLHSVAAPAAKGSRAAARWSER